METKKTTTHHVVDLEVTVNDPSFETASLLARQVLRIPVQEEVDAGNVADALAGLLRRNG